MDQSPHHLGPENHRDWIHIPYYHDCLLHPYPLAH
jgi:hypothetical protein